MQRRHFIQRAGLTLGTIGATAAAAAPPRRAPAFEPEDWSSVRAQFALTPSVIHMSMFLLASHPHDVTAPSLGDLLGGFQV